MIRVNHAVDRRILGLHTYRSLLNSLRTSVSLELVALTLALRKTQTAHSVSHKNRAGIKPKNEAAEVLILQPRFSKRILATSFLSLGSATVRC